MATKRAEHKMNTNSMVDKRFAYRRKGAYYCSYCAPNKGCNSKKKAKHGARKPRHKDKRM